MFSADKITDESDWKNATRSTWSKKNVRHKDTARKTKSHDTQQTNR